MIRLRPYKPSDAWDLLKWWDGRTEEEFVKWSAGAFTYPLTIEQLDAYFETWCLKEGGGWPVMALDASGKPVGHFLVRSVCYSSNAAGLAFIVVDPKCRGKGYGREMISQALSMAFWGMGMERVFLTVFENNPKALACYEASGFRKQAYLPEYWKEGETVCGAFLMEAVRPETNQDGSEEAGKEPAGSAGNRPRG